jgi:cytochrome b561
MSEENSKPVIKNYHPALIALHWLVAILIFVTAYLALGSGEERGAIPSLSIAGLPPIGLHMSRSLLKPK